MFGKPVWRGLLFLQGFLLNCIFIGVLGYSFVSDISPKITWEK